MWVQWIYMHDLLYQSMVRAVAFFDLFDHPLTDRELYEYLYDPPVRTFSYHTFVTLSSVYRSLDGALCYTDGMWHLQERESIIVLRNKRNMSWHRKLGVIRWAVFFLSRIPFVRAVLVCNTTAFSACDDMSDIDVVIIVRSGRMWTVRMLSVVVLSLARLRRTHSRVTDRICLSFYVADKALNMSKLRIDDDEDIYLAYWLMTLVPLFDPDRLGESIVRANQSLLQMFVWRTSFTPRALSFLPHPYRTRTVCQRIGEYWCGGMFGDRLERMVRSVQYHKMMRNQQSVVHCSDTRVVVSDTVLKFHERDRRLLYREKWHARLTACGI